MRLRTLPCGRRRGGQGLPTIKLDQLPVEVVSEICENVPETDIPNVRLTSRFLRDVATPFLLDEIHLVFKRSSFDRLLEISQHPVISRSVTSLFYEPDSLDRFRSREDWEDNIIEPSYLDLLQRLPRRGASEEEQRQAEQREKEQNKDRRRMGDRSKQYSEEDLAKGWSAYQAIFEEQEFFRSRGYGFEEIFTAMRRLLNLHAITMSQGCTVVTRTKYLDKTFSASLQRPGAVDDSGIPPSRSLLLGAARAGLSLKTVQLGPVDWKLLHADDGEFAEMKDSLKSVCEFEIHITTGYDENTDDIGVEIPECHEYLSNCRLWHLIRDTPLLESLLISFDWYEPTSPAQLTWIVGDTKWDFLSSVAFQCIDTDERSWVAFFCRHQKTLREVCFEDIRFVTGEWPSALEEMHDALSLTSAHVQGRLIGEDPHQCWHLDAIYPASSDDYTSPSNRTREAIEDYLIGWGDCPLLDEEEHPQTE